MARTKIDYGIDLGTTNSAICRMEKGEPKIIRTDINVDIMPSNISFTKRGSLRVGQTAKNDITQDARRATKTWSKGTRNTFGEFKRTMATNTPCHSSFMEKDYSSEELSAEVLKTLKSFVTDESFSSVVITVPAKFNVNQKTATIEAAQMAGFKQCELLQEPIAAAMAYGLTTDCKNGIWMVFDFGGGTFDAALLKVEDGIMQVFDTEGNNYLGGKNLDYAIVDNIIIPYLTSNYSLSETMANADKKEILREAMKTYAEEVKNQLSFKEEEDILSNLGELGEDENGEEIELDLTVTQTEIFDVMRPYFQEAVDICKDLLKRNHLSGPQINKLILVGGPTHSPLIRQMLKEQVCPNVDTGIDPMTAVATGAALYASTIDTDISDEDIAIDTIKLEIGYEATSVDTTEWVSIKLPADAKQDKVYVELMRGDKAWSSGKTGIDKNGNVIEANLIEGKPNSFTVMCYDAQGNALPCFLDEITIIQGTKVGAAPLPYNIGIAKWNDSKKRGVFNMIKGLEKNKLVPATGVANGLKTTCQLRPGVENDILTVPIYQVDDFSEAEGRTASLYDHVANVVVTGDDVDVLIPADSSVDVTLKVDSSEQMTLEIHFLASDITIEKKLDTGKKHKIEEADTLIRKQLEEAQQGIDRLAHANISDVSLQEKLERVKEEAKNNPEKKAVLENLRKVLREIEDLDKSTEWQRLETELREEFDRLERAQNDLGNEKSAQLVEHLRSQTDHVIRNKDVSMGHDLLEQINSLFAQLTMVYQCMGLIRNCQNRFGTIHWKDSARARQLIDHGLDEMNNHPTEEKLRPIAIELIKLMPDEDAANTGGLLR